MAASMTEKAITEPADIERMLEMRRNRASLRTLAEEFGVSHTTISNYLAELGDPKPPPAKRKPPPAKPTYDPEDLPLCVVCGRNHVSRPNRKTCDEGHVTIRVQDREGGSRRRRMRCALAHPLLYRRHNEDYRRRQRLAHAASNLRNRDARRPEQVTWAESVRKQAIADGEWPFDDDLNRIEGA